MNASVGTVSIGLYAVVLFSGTDLSSSRGMTAQAVIGIGGFGDADGDGFVTLDDFAVWTSCDGLSPTSTLPSSCEVVDANQDDRVDIYDFAVFQRVFGLHPPAGTCETDDDCADANPCTIGRCEPGLGCVFAPVPGECNDGDACTGMDRCIGLGRCEGVDIAGERCTTNADCFDAICNPTTESCVCNDVPDLRLEVVSSDDPLPADEPVAVRVVLGESTQLVVGGQFLVAYDPSMLAFIDAVPGGQVDERSPFAFELFGPADDPTAGEVFYAVGTGLDPAAATYGPAVMASLRFRTLAATPAPVPVCFRSTSLKRTVLVGSGGNSISFLASCLDER